MPGSRWFPSVRFHSSLCNDLSRICQELGPSSSNQCKKSTKISICDASHGGMVSSFSIPLIIIIDYSLIGGACFCERQLYQASQLCIQDLLESVPRSSGPYWPCEWGAMGHYYGWKRCWWRWWSNQCGQINDICLLWRSLYSFKPSETMNLVLFLIAASIILWYNAVLFAL